MPITETRTDPFHHDIRDAWLAWLNSPRGRARWRRWADHHPALQSWLPPELVDPRGGERTDAMQAALVALAQDGEVEPVFGLAVQLRPGLLGIVRAARPTIGADAGNEVWSAFVETVYRHPLDRRPGRIAANLVLDTRHRITTSRDRPPALGTGRAPTGTEPVVERSAGRPDGERWIELVDQLRRAVERLPGTDRSRRLTATVAYRAWFLDEPHELIAAHLGIGERSVATRLLRLREPLREMLLAEAGRGEDEPKLSSRPAA